LEVVKGITEEIKIRIKIEVREKESSMMGVTSNKDITKISTMIITTRISTMATGTGDNIVTNREEAKATMKMVIVRNRVGQIKVDITKLDEEATATKALQILRETQCGRKDLNA